MCRGIAPAIPRRPMSPCGSVGQAGRRRRSRDRRQCAAPAHPQRDGPGWEALNEAAPGWQPLSAQEAGGGASAHQPTLPVRTRICCREVNRAGPREARASSRRVALRSAAPHPGGQRARGEGSPFARAPLLTRQSRKRLPPAPGVQSRGGTSQRDPLLFASGRADQRNHSGVALPRRRR